MTEHLSKYAAKQRAKAEGKWQAPMAPAMPEEPEEMFADLGSLPALCASHLENARLSLLKAANVAMEMERLAAPGIQKQEPIGLKGACNAMAKRLHSLAKRAAKVVQGGDE